jgi:hypothetical protein
MTMCNQPRRWGLISVNRLGRTRLAALAACAAMLGTTVRAADNPAAWAPQDTLVYVGMADCDAFGKLLEKTAAFRSLEDPAAKQMTQPWVKLADKTRELVAKRLGLDDPKMVELRPHGAAAFYMNTRPDTGEKPDVVPQLIAVADMGEDLDKAKRLAKAVVQKSVEQGARREVVEIAGVEATGIKFPKQSQDATAATGEGKSFMEEMAAIIESDEVGLDPTYRAMLSEAARNFEAPDEFEFAFAFRGPVLTVGSDLSALRQALRVQREDADATFAKDAALRLLERKCDAKAPMHLVVNLPEAFKQIQRYDPDDGGKFIEASGLKSFGPAVMTLWPVPSDDLDSRLRGFVKIGDMNSGIGRMLKMDNTPSAPPASVGANAAGYGSINIDVPTIYDEVLKIVTRMNPAEGEQMRAGSKVPLPDGTMLDIRNEVLAHLTGPLFGYATMDAPFAADDLNVLVGMGHKSRPAFDKLLGLAQGMLVGREMMGAQVYDLNMIPIMGIQLAVTDRHLIPIGSRKAVEGFIRAEGKTDGGLAGERRFRKLARHVPERCCAMIYQDAQRAFDAGMVAKDAGLNPDQPPIFGGSIGTLLQWQLAQAYTGSQMDDLKALRKYQTLTLLTLSSESDGLRLDGVSMVAPEDK